jgi:hypothetical protein
MPIDIKPHQQKNSHQSSNLASPIPLHSSPITQKPHKRSKDILLLLNRLLNRLLAPHSLLLTNPSIIAVAPPGLRPVAGNFMLRDRSTGMVFQTYGDVGLVVAAGGLDSKDIVVVLSGDSTGLVGETPGQPALACPLFSSGLFSWFLVFFPA